MRLSYTNLLNTFLDNTANPGSSNANLLSFFKIHLNTRYQEILSQLQNYQSQTQKTASTVAAQQYYHNPVGLMNIETATVTVNSMPTPLEIIDSQRTWDRINQTPNFTSSSPEFLYPRRDDFGIFPIPQGVYSITLNYTLRDRSLTTADYTDGTITLTPDSQTVTGVGTTFISSMIGRWLNVEGDYWYRISARSSATVISLETKYEGVLTSGLTYRICETPELPEEAHILLAAGATADWYSGPRSDVAKATWFNNVFWTGDGNNNDRSGRNVGGGLIGLVKRYSNRSNSGIINRRKTSSTSDLWATTIS